ncbi:methyltransferase domain-containing protein [Roseibium algae]|uniref:Methyltransferase domain-containing protein n=1 Tax=Roseibium algae TaxID=3123038 RepID=A0ABU8TNI7_9HYPH
MTQPDLFDRSLLKRRRLRALKEAKPGSDFLLETVAEDLADRLAIQSRNFDTAVELGGHTGRITSVLRESGKVETVWRGDLLCSETCDANGPDFVFDDALPPLREKSLGLVTSALSLHWVNDLPGALVQIRQALKPDGLFLGVLLGGDTLHELRDVLMRAELEVTGGAAPRVSPFADTRDLGSLLQRAGFALPVTDMDRLTVRYSNMFGLMQDLRSMGATSVLEERSRKPLPKSVFLRAAELYAADYADPDGKIRATFAMISLSGWAPHESQQKPLKPGSAKTRLADALGVNEVGIQRND